MVRVRSVHHARSCGNRATIRAPGCRSEMLATIVPRVVSHPVVQHAITQAVKVVSMPVDPLEKQSLQVAQQTLSWAVAAFIIGVVALIIGGVALGIALWDAFNNSRLLRIALAKAKFVINVTGSKHFLLAKKDGRKTIRFQVSAKNVGEKASQRYLLTMYAPLSVCEDASAYTGERETIGGIEYKVLRFREYPETLVVSQLGSTPTNTLRDIVLFPNGKGIEFPFGLHLNADVSSITFRWRMYSEDAVSPDGDYGTITLAIPV